MMQYKQILLLILFFTLLRVIAAPTFGLGVDEAHYILYAYYLDWSYVDHPPLVGWVHALFMQIFGDSLLSTRLPAILIMAYISLESYKLLRTANIGEKEALWSIAALNSSFMFGAIGLMLLPENLLLVFIFPLIRTVLRIEEKKRVQDYLWLGFWLGLLGLSKYTAIILIIPLFLYLIIKKRVDLLITPYTLITIIIGLLMIIPVIVWNYRHEWISFVYQSSHVTGSTVISFKSFFRSFIAQFGAYNPILFSISIYGTLKALRSKVSSIYLSGLIALSIEIFFLITALLKPVLPHWPALFYLLMIPIGIANILQTESKSAKVWRYAIMFSIILNILIHAELALKIGKFPDYKSPFRDIYGYESIVEEGTSLLNNVEEPKKALAVTNWTYGSRIGYYAMPYKVKTFVLDDYNRQFSFWEKDTPLGYDLIIIKSHFASQNDIKSLQCDSLTSLKSTDLVLNGSKVDTVDYYYCKNYQGRQ